MRCPSFHLLSLTAQTTQKKLLLNQPSQGKISGEILKLLVSPVDSSPESMRIFNQVINSKVER